MANTKKTKEVTVESILDDFYTLKLTEQVKVKDFIKTYLNAKAKEAQEHLDLLSAEK